MTSDATTRTDRRLDDYVLDDNTLAELASLICGDDGPYYRAGWQLEQLLRNAGWTDFDEYDRGPRRQWLLKQLQARKQDPGRIASLVRRLADSREYLDDTTAGEETIRQVNELLAHEGFRIRSLNGRGEIIDATAADAPEQHAPAQLATSIAALVHDPAAARALQRRLDETIACQEGGAYMSAVIMMGSLLEGVLVEVFRQRGTAAPNGAMTPLQHLITRAHQLGYIQADVHEFSQSLRDFRNLVHVHKQLRTGHAPDRDTARVCWWVVVAALNDLAASAPR
jgi:hypothetical protein